MGWESKDIGDAGEGIFKRLALEWGASFLSTPSASGTDGYLQWYDLPGIRLWVQIKSILQYHQSTSFLPVYIRPGVLSEWYTYRPLLVVCEIRTNRAWWLDTAKESWYWGTVKGKTFHVPTDQPVDQTSKQAVRRIALQRPRVLQPYVFMTSSSSSAPNPELQSYSALKDLSFERVKEVLTNAYQEMKSVGVHERDIIALSVARLIQSQLDQFSAIPLDSFIELVSARLLSKEWGGRSFTLGTLASLLQPGLLNPLDDTFIDILTKASELAVAERSFLNPEFGLIISASLSQRFPTRTDLPEHLEYLATSVIHSPQNLTVENVAHSMLEWLDHRTEPLDQKISRHWLAHQVIRPLPADADIFLHIEDAEESVKQILEFGLEGVSPKDLILTDQLIRLRSSELIGKWTCP